MSYDRTFSVAEGLEYLDKEIAARLAGEYRIRSTGFDELDKILGGLHPKTLTIIGATTSMGKSSLALQLFHNMCMQKQACLLFSLEMGAVQLLRRLASNISEKPEGEFFDGTDMTRISMRKSLDGYEGFDGPMIDDTSGITVDYIENQLISFIESCRRYGADTGAVIIDYLQIMNTNQQRGTLAAEIGAITKRLKQLAMIYDIPFIVLSQLNRNVDHRITNSTKDNKDNGRPRLSDLRDSGSIEQDADAVLFIYRGKYYESMRGEWRVGPDEECEIIVAKNRSGPTGTAYLTFKPRFTKFVARGKDSSAGYDGGF